MPIPPERASPASRQPPRHQENDDAEDEDIEDRCQAVQKDGQRQAAPRAGDAPAPVREEAVDAHASSGGRRRRAFRRPEEDQAAAGRALSATRHTRSPKTRNRRRRTMARVKRGVGAKRRHKKVLEQAKGYYGN